MEDLEDEDCYPQFVLGTTVRRKLHPSLVEVDDQERGKSLLMSKDDSFSFRSWLWFDLGSRKCFSGKICRQLFLYDDAVGLILGFMSVCKDVSWPKHMNTPGLYISFFETAHIC